MTTPLTPAVIAGLQVGEPIALSGRIYCGRDAVLPRLARLAAEGGDGLAALGVDLTGAVIFHTAVSPAGIGPTTSNKVEIEGSIPALSQGGVRLHLGKGALGPATVAALAQAGSVFAITPPLTALFSACIVSSRVAAFPEEGMEALYELEVRDLPAIIAVASGRSIFAPRPEEAVA
ncbi:MAG: fumarate hydratase C-terminal domain-containing protein [Deltaproteobacteria bacterium]|nr:fumarate hydratase C-terminal domain-containing protein [Deltaproteobacteria bacterium]